MTCPINYKSQIFATSYPFYLPSKSNPQETMSYTFSESNIPIIKNLQCIFFFYNCVNFALHHFIQLNVASWLFVQCFIYSSPCLSLRPCFPRVRDFVLIIFVIFLRHCTKYRVVTANWRPVFVIIGFCMTNLVKFRLKRENKKKPNEYTGKHAGVSITRSQ